MDTGALAALDKRVQNIFDTLLWVEKASALVTNWVRDIKPLFRWAETQNDGTPIETACIAAEGLLFNPNFAATLADKDLAFVLLHEICHVAFDSLNDFVAVGVGSADGFVLDAAKCKALGYSQDSVINGCLIADNIISKGPLEGAITFDALNKMVQAWGGQPYAGNKTDSIETYEWFWAAMPPETKDALRKQAQQQADQDERDQQQGQPGQPGQQSQPGHGAGQKPGTGQGKGGVPDIMRPTGPTAGCMPFGKPKAMTPEKVEQMRVTIREAGRGSALGKAMAPKAGRISWRDVLRNAMNQALTDSASRTVPTYSRASRRPGLFPGVVLAGRAGSTPRLAVCLDISGSMGDDAVATIASECLKIQKDYPKSQVFLVTHTDRPTWFGWLKPGGDASSITAATAYTGGTDCHEAWKLIQAEGKFDSMVHFTDGEIIWPEQAPVKAERLTIALTGYHASNPHQYRAPRGAKALGITNVNGG